MFTPSVVSFQEEYNQEVEIPRHRPEDKRTLWISHLEIRHNSFLVRVREMVEDKLVELFTNANDDDISLLDMDCLDENDGWQEQKYEEEESDEELLITKKTTIIEHLTESIMDRPRDEIYSFLSSKPTISFQKK